VAVALLDGEVGPAQYAEGRIVREDVQSLLRRVAVRPKLTFTWLYPKEMPSRISARTHDGRFLRKEKSDYEGFRSRPMSWERVAEKFDRLAAPYADEALRRELVAAVGDLETIPVSHLTGLLARAGCRGERNIGAA
jgi:2-methylcitrate dehydratase